MFDSNGRGSETGRVVLSPRRRLRRLLWRTAAVLAVAAFLASCVDARMAGEQDAGTPDTFAEMLEVLWGFKALPASTDPTIIITDPVDFKSFDQQVPVTPVVVTFSVLNWSYPDPDNLIYVYLDDVLLDQVGAGGTVVIDDVPFGMHVVALVLMEKDAQGVYEELKNEESRAAIRVKVVKECSDQFDSSCDDSNPCSEGDSCVFQAGEYKCGYGYKIGECCTSAYECPVGWLCYEAECKQCLEGLGMCEDNELCTVDSCEDGICVNDWQIFAQGACCHAGLADPDAACDDGLYCTTDWCNLAAQFCESTPSADPSCCESDPDPVCDDNDPCTLDKCIAHECRHGPVPDPGCCHDDLNCDDGNLCTDDSCVEDSCEHVQNGLPNCCTLHTQCGPGGEWDDGNPATIDYCQSFQCLHMLNPTFCDDSGEHPCLPDDNPCTVDLCDFGSFSCQHTPTQGCCVLPSDCNDYDPCTEEDCPLAGETGTCESEEIDGCCNENEECDDNNLCNLDACINHVCRHGPDPGKSDCCLSESDCDDGCDCTVDTCLTNIHACHYQKDPLEPLCCLSSLECDDGNAYTVDKCVNCLCLVQDSPDICNPVNISCNDDNPCTIDTCDLQNEQCHHTYVAGCCLQDSDCDDAEYCTQDSCDKESDPQAPECLNELIQACCQSDAECADGNPCTTDVCVNKACKTISKPSCCLTDDDCATGFECHVGTCDPVTKECVYSVDMDNPVLDCCTTIQDCYDNKVCTDDLCIDFECQNPNEDGCCTEETAEELCNDSNLCTYDVCVFGVCRNLGPDVAPPVANLPESCCVENSDCPDDGDQCTLDFCDLDTNLCVYEALAQCYVSLPYIQAFNSCDNLLAINWSVVDLGTETTDNWSCGNGLPLGPDSHMAFDWQPLTVDFGSLLASPWLTLAGQSHVTVQFDRHLDYFDGEVDLGLWITESGDFTDPVGSSAMWFMTAGDDVEAGTADYAVPSIYLGKNVQLALYVASDTTYNVNRYSVDNFRVCPGHPPKFVETPPLQLVTWSQSKLLTIKASDLDDSAAISFTIDEGPSFVSLTNADFNWFMDHATVDLNIEPAGPGDVGDHTIRIRITDGCLLDVLTVQVKVLLDGGYAVWNPDGVSDAFADALKDAAS